MTSPIDDWEQLQTEWQNYQPDMQQIKRKTNWVTWRMIVILLIDVIAMIGYFPFLIFVVKISEISWLEASWHIFMGVVILIGSYLDFKIRLPILRMQGDTTKDILELYLKRVKAGIRVGRYGAWFALLILVFFIAWFAANVYFAPNASKIFTWKFITFGTFWITLIGVLCLWYQWKKEKELKRLMLLWKDYV